MVCNPTSSTRSSQEMGQLGVSCPYVMGGGGREGEGDGKSCRDSGLKSSRLPDFGFRVFGFRVLGVRM